jgi:regulator of replication initiation timing
LRQQNDELHTRLEEVTSKPNYVLDEISRMKQENNDLRKRLQKFEKPEPESIRPELQQAMIEKRYEGFPM